MPKNKCGECHFHGREDTPYLQCTYPILYVRGVEVAKECGPFIPKTYIQEKEWINQWEDK